MLSVVLIWIYVIITTYLTGFAFLKFVTSLDCMQSQKNKSKTGYKKYNPHYRESYIMAGIVVNTVYAQIYSLMAGVGVSANLILIAFCTLIAVYYRQELFEEVMDAVRITVGSRVGLYYILIFLLMAYGTSHGIMHYDSDLYHAQAIRWIEEYGIVRGLGNLHVRLAYNSSSFALAALYSMSFLGKSYHAMAGFFALMLAWQCLDLKDILRRKQPILSDFARIMAIYYLFTIFDEMVAPASDYYLSCIVFYIIIHWLDMNVRHTHSYVPYIMLALTGVYAVTIKLSAAPILILAIIPIYKLLHKGDPRKYKALGVSVVLALIIVLPFLIRNIIISGWLVYPVTGIDLFNLKWEIPKEIAAYDAAEIRAYGRGLDNQAIMSQADGAALWETDFKAWASNWFAGIHGLNKVMIVLDVVAIVVYVLCLIYFFAVALSETPGLKNKLNTGKVFKLSTRSMLNFADFLTISGSLVVCLLFWFFSAPLIRYGEVYVCLTFAIIFGRFLIHGFNKLGVDSARARLTIQIFATILVAWIGYKGVRLVIDDVSRFNAANFLTQQDYGDYEVDTFVIGDVTFYYPVEGDRIGYKYFPSAPRDMTGQIELIGKRIEDGIVYKNPQP